MSMHRRRSAAVRLLLAGVAMVAPAIVAGPAHAVTADQRQEMPINSTSPQADVLASVVRLHVPMLPGAAPHDAKCDWIAYERWRSASGPAKSTDADSVVVLQPGVLEGATAFDQVARNTVRASARRGRHIEVWGIDRRANCLEDKTGIEYAEKTDDLDAAMDYYYRGEALDGKRFAGWNQDTRILADTGIAQVVNDQYTVLTSELPDQAWRERHVICGGHSMGGPVTEIFASWDFDGNAATTEDAGWRQCAAFVGLDTMLRGGMASRPTLDQLTGGLLTAFNGVTVSALKRGSVRRYADLLGISPQTMTLLELIAVGADHKPDADMTSLVRNAPRTRSIEDYLKLGASPDLSTWLGRRASMRDYRWTRMGFLGQALDDNGAVYGLVRTSFGFPTGTDLQMNRLPRQAKSVPFVGQLITPDPLVLPRRSSAGQLQGWANYDELGSGPHQIGLGITDPSREVADAAQVARAIHEGPLNLTETWFPIRLIVDQLLLSSGDRSGSLAGSMHADPVVRKPRIVIRAGDSFGGTATPRDPVVIAPGYQHLDPLMASEKQNNGRPEITSQTIADMIDTAVPR